MDKRVVLVLVAQIIVLCSGADVNLVLVHGAWEGGLVWDQVETILNSGTLSPSNTWTISAPTLIGHPGNDNNVDPLTVTFQMYVDQITDIVNAQSVPVVLAGHSFGGMIISQVAENIPTKIKALVYIAAYIPTQDSQNLLVLSAGDTGSQILPHLVFGYGYIQVVNASDVFFNDCGSSSVIQSAIADVESAKEPIAGPATNVTLTQNNFHKVPKYYIKTLQDRVISPPFQQVMYTTTPVLQVLEMVNGSHASMVCDPSQLATHLNNLATTIYASSTTDGSTTGGSTAGGSTTGGSTTGGGTTSMAAGLGPFNVVGMLAIFLSIWQFLLQ